MSRLASVETRLTRRRLLRFGLGMFGGGLPAFLWLRQHARAAQTGGVTGQAKSCIVLYCWGGMSHHETFDLKPDAPVEIRGEFQPIATSVPGILVSEHLPRLSRQMQHLAVIRSIHHDSSAHGKGMYWNLTGHAPPQSTVADNLPPSRSDWPSLGAMVSKFRASAPGLPRSVRLPYPLVDNKTLQAGEYGGWLGVAYDPIVMRTPAGREFGGVSRDLGSAVLNLAEQFDEQRLASRQQLRQLLEKPVGRAADFEGHEHFQKLAHDILLTAEAKRAYRLDQEDPRIRDSYGDHLCGQSLLLARRLTEAGVPIITVCCAAGDLNGAVGDHWDTHGDNFRRLKNTMLPVFDQAVAALLADLDQRGTLAETLVVLLTDFGRTPAINRSAGRDHYPSVYSMFLAGGGIRGGQVYGSSDAHGALPKSEPCTPADVHATIFHALGISPRAELRDPLDRPLPISDGNLLPLS